MDIAVNVLLVILLAVASVFLIYLIGFIKQTQKNLTAVQLDIHQLKERIDPILIKVDQISDNVINITEDVEEQIASVKRVVEDVTDKVEGLLNIDKKIKENLDSSPVAGIYKKVVAMSHGVSAFWNTLLHRSS